jgi:DNA-binding YbaB/EbfC family protein
MLKGLGDMGNLLKLQKEMKGIQKKLKKTKIEGESVDGLVKAVVNGEYELVSISIDDAAAGDAQKLEKHVLTAVNDATEKMKSHTAAEMSSITGGLNIPGLS